MAHSSMSRVPGPPKYPPPPTIASHSNQPPPQLQQSRARETLRSAISFKPHAGRLVAELWFSCACSPIPLYSGLSYKVSSVFTHCLNNAPFCTIAFLWFLLYSLFCFFQALLFSLLISLCVILVYGLWNLDPSVGKGLFLWRPSALKSQFQLR